MVIATQNPFEFEGTYLLPENQLDRFLLRISLGYPERNREKEILLQQPGRFKLDHLEPVLSTDDVRVLQGQATQIKVDPGADGLSFGHCGSEPHATSSCTREYRRAVRYADAMFAGVGAVGRAGLCHAG